MTATARYILVCRIQPAQVTQTFSPARIFHTRADAKSVAQTSKPALRVRSNLSPFACEICGPSHPQDRGKQLVLQIPQNDAIAYGTLLEGMRVPLALQRESRKWLRYYLDFCAKYRQAPGDDNSLPEFLRKLSSRGQFLQSLQTAAASVEAYLNLSASRQAFNHESSVA